MTNVDCLRLIKSQGKIARDAIEEMKRGDGPGVETSRNRAILAIETIINLSDEEACCGTGPSSGDS